jgi:hypothetical protein
MRKLRNTSGEVPGDHSGAIDDATEIGTELRHPQLSTDEANPFVYWCIRGIAGAINLLDGYVANSAVMYPAALDEIVKLRDRMIAIVDREKGKK